MNMLSIRTRTALLSLAALALASSQALAGDGARVLVLSSSDSGLDGHIELVLESSSRRAAG
jgi:hypothetical protein